MISRNKAHSKGFIALISSLIIGALLATALLSSSAPIFQYRQTVDQKIRAVKLWHKEQQEKDATDFYFFN